jgi:heme/copper-type cytochrome/quinol oxidase subunit 4
MSSIVAFRSSVIQTLIAFTMCLDTTIENMKAKIHILISAQTFRKLNAVTVPTIVKVPKTEEEDMKMKAEREKSV